MEGQNEKETAMTLPFVSVIMPVRNEGGFIEKSLNAVLAQDYPADKFEVIIADGMSRDGTREKISAFIEHDARIFMLDNPSGKTPCALNTALQKARGEIIVRVDGHAVIEPDYISQCVRILQSGHADAVGGPIETIGENFMAGAIACAMSSVFGVGNSAFRTSSVKQFTDTVPFPAYPKKWIEKAGIFDEEMQRNQDDEYNFRIRKLGGRVLLAPEIRSKYFSRSNLFLLAKQYFQYGFWKVRVLQKHPEGMSFRQFVPPVFVSLCFFLPFVPAASALLHLMLTAYLIFILTGSVQTALKGKPQYLALLPFIFAVLHFAYGAGFLWGLIFFTRNWFKKE